MADNLILSRHVSHFGYNLEHPIFLYLSLLVNFSSYGLDRTAGRARRPAENNRNNDDSMLMDTVLR